MAWKPFVRTQSTKADFDCTYSGQRFGSYGDLERWAKANRKTVVPTKEYERDLIRGRTPEEKLAAKQPEVRKELEKNVYRLRHGIDVRE